MNLKPAVKYLLSDVLKPLAIFYAVIAALFALALISDGMVSGLEFASMNFILVTALLSFKSPFRMLLQNGLSRNTLFIAIIIRLIGVAIAMATIDTVIGFIGYISIDYSSFLWQSYDQQPWFKGLLWYCSIYLWFGLIGFLVAGLYYRMNNPLRLLVSIGIPVLLVIISFIDGSSGGAIYGGIADFFSFAWGFKNGNNPYYAIVSCIIFSIITGGLGYLLVRRATVKE